MEVSDFKKIYLLINIPIIIIVFILLLSPLIVTEKLAIYYIGVAARMLLGIWCLFNGIWNACTDYYSILKLNIFNKKRSTPRWGWWLLFIVGVICIITAFMGFGFNNVMKPI